MVDTASREGRTFLAPSSLSVFIISTSGKGEGVKEKEVGAPAAGRSISGGARYTEYWFSCGYNRYTRVTRASVTLSAAICRPSFRRSEPTPRGNRIGSEAYREESKERREGKRRRKSEERRGIYIYIYREKERDEVPSAIGGSVASNAMAVDGGW